MHLRFPSFAGRSPKSRAYARKGGCDARSQRSRASFFFVPICLNAASSGVIKLLTSTPSWTCG